MPAEKENVATTTIKTCQTIQDHLQNFFCNVKTNWIIDTHQKQQGLKLQANRMKFERPISWSILKNYTKMMGYQKSLQKLAKFPIIVVFSS